MPAPDPISGVTPIKTYSLEEVAAMVLPPELKSPVRWLSARLTNGTIAGYRIGRTWRMTREDVEDLITRHRNNARPIPVKPDVLEVETPESPHPGDNPYGISRRSWMLRQKAEIPGTTQHTRKYGIRTEATSGTNRRESPGFWYKVVQPESEAVIYNMPPLSDTQQALLDRVRNEGKLVVDATAKRTVESLVRRDLVAYEVAYVENPPGGGRVYQFTVRAKDS